MAKSNFFHEFFLFSGEKSQKSSKPTKKLENGKKVFWLAFRCAQHPKAGQNTQHIPAFPCNLIISPKFFSE